MSSPPKFCPQCSETSMHLDSYCGAWVCDYCEYHQGLVRCYCGWSLSGGDGRRELEDMGETIEEEP